MAEREREIQGEVHLEIGRYITGGRDIIKVKVVEARLVFTYFINWK